MTRFEVWAPNARAVEVVLAPGAGAVRHAMEPVAGPGAPRPAGRGWWQAEVADAPAGTDYAFSLDGGEPLPDPRSRWQPTGVDGPSRVVDHGAFAWTDDAWTGRELGGSVVYELHVGTFTPTGTFDAAIERLDHLGGLGVDFVEVLPVAAFPGHHGWGYDGVGLYAVQDSYGGPEAFKRFVDACHDRGMAVLLDVVYNHLGPYGNVLGRYGPYFTDVYTTPWGAAVNFDRHDSDPVRAFVVENALSWLRDYHLDGLRLDAVHAIVDTRALPILEELSTAVDALAGELDRPLALIAESDLNDPRLVTPRVVGGRGMTAQWSDDFHHALHAALTGERAGYYQDFGSLHAIAKALTRAFVIDGCFASYRGRSHGRPVDRARLSGHRFVGYTQTHDQVGNRATGERLSALVGHQAARVAAALALTSPFTPMLFMGEEWGAATPWQYFTDHVDPRLAREVSAGRRSEFAAFGWSPEEVPDPQDGATFRRSVLDWSEPDGGEHAATLAWYRRLVELRRAHPELASGDLRRVQVDLDEDERWLVVHRGPFRVAANLAAERRAVPLGAGSAELVAGSDPGAAVEFHDEAPGRTARDPDATEAWVSLDGPSAAILRTAG